MVTEPNIDKSDLRDILEDEYGFQIVSLTFVPKGECSWSYKVTTADNEQYFLKIHGDQKVSPDRFKFLSDLNSKCNIQNITYPKLTKSGKEEIIITNYPAVLFNYIEGHNAHEQQLTSEQQYKLGRLLFNVHSSKTLTGNYPIKETFDIPFKNDFLGIFEELNNITPGANRYKQELKELLERNRDRIFQEYNQLVNLQETCRKLDLEFVNCHGDPTPENILITKTGEIDLIDWDDTIFAPKEKDLVFFTSEKYKFVLEAYGEANGKLSLNETVIDFYNHRRNVGEIADYGTRILFYEEADQQVEHHLVELKRSLKEMGLR